ncbi:DUF3592 domain-containing protein [Nocardiopsis gilva YIM 90087]|uniref:DUF3592 domain-containing protein n=1 Tax=Nocardiopsis gilva YIM 90087 TaxID=1235441 RepID=A0A223SC14_9ACTN|nr:DUF3592 domain-containing protein [Nocardiopsis gilva]ASU85569.1 DUF3592 domain-containing protein [Nocardiopsis gilva YIM 90087]
MANDDGTLLILTAAFGLFGLAFSVLGIVLVRRENVYRTRGVAVPGQVTDVVSRVSSGGGGRRSGPRTYYHPVVAYRTLEGRDIHERATIGTNPPRYSPGQYVQVLYLPESPDRFRVAGDSSGKFTGYAFTIFGLIFIAISVVVLVNGLL